MTGVNPLEEYFRNNDSRLIHKWMHYFEVYHRHFERFRGRPVVVLEFGVNQGGSLEMWRDYFGPDAKIYGVDIDPRCRQFEDDNIRILIGDQADKEFLQRGGRRDRSTDRRRHRGRRAPDAPAEDDLPAHLPPHERRRVLPHRGHAHQLLAGYGGGFRRRGTFMQFAKHKIDQLNAWHSKTEELQVDEFTRTTDSIHFYDSIVVFERGKRTKPVHRITGRRRSGACATPGASD